MFQIATTTRARLWGSLDYLAGRLPRKSRLWPDLTTVGDHREPASFSIQDYSRALQAQ